ncbi:MAG: Crp/Fnr family transcriptional regulator [Chloroflexota bacterium]
MDPKLELLRKVPLFQNCDKGSIEEVGRLAEEVDVPAGKVLMREGDSADAFYMIVTGGVRIERTGSAARELGPGQWLGEIALVDHGPRTATATTTGPTRLFVLGHREFDQMLDKHPGFRAQVMESLAKRVRNLEPDASH